jgi:hypothetical protein
MRRSLLNLPVNDFINQEKEELFSRLEEYSPIDLDSLTVEEQAKTISYRNWLVKQIVFSEFEYVDHLNTLITIFINPLRSLNIISQKEILDLFSNAEELYILHKELLESIEERVNNWSDTQKLGDIFVDMAPSFENYSTYCHNFDFAIQTLERISENQNFKLFLEKSKEHCKLSGIRSYLTLPIRRIPKCILQLEELVKNSWKSHQGFFSFSFFYYFNL